MLQKFNKSSKKRIPFASRFEIGVAILLACLNLFILAVLCEIFWNIPSALLAIPVALVYLAEIAFLGYLRQSSLNALPEKNIHELLSENGSVIIRNSVSPIIAIDSFGTVLWKAPPVFWQHALSIPAVRLHSLPKAP